MKERTPYARWPRAFGRWPHKARNLLARDVWGIALVEAPIARFLKGWPEDAATVWLDDPAAGYHADPFAIRVNGRTIVLTEHVAEPGRHGELVGRELGDDGRLSRARPTLRLPIHLSYPFVIEQDGTTYCIPETIQADGVLLFRAVGPEPRWVLDRRLIDRFPAADSTVIFHVRKFWLFCTRYAIEPDDPVNRELHIWHADDLRGPWLPHVGNPVKMDRSNARPAGTPFLHEGELFRPAQDCSRTYGGSVKINRVTVLTETEFAEEPVAMIEPRKDSPFPDGLHHLSSFGDTTFIDGKRTVRDEFGSERDFPPPADAATVAAALADLAQ
jgi:hypothetical protein